MATLYNSTTGTEPIDPAIAASWADSDGGAGPPVSGNPPGAGDTAIVTANGKSMTATAAITAGYNLTINGVGKTFTLAAGSSNTFGTVTVSAGTLAAGTASITNTGFTLSGGTFTGSGAMAVNGNLTYTSGTNSHTGAWTQSGTANLSWNSTSYPVADYTVAASAAITLTANSDVKKATVPTTASFSLGNYLFSPAYYSTEAVSLQGTWTVGSGYVRLIANGNNTNSGTINIGSVPLQIIRAGAQTWTQSGPLTCGTLLIRGSIGTAATLTMSGASGNLTATAVTLGITSADDYSGILSLGSGTHSIASIAAGNAANLNNAIDFGTSSTTISGTANLTNIKTVSSAAATLSASAWTLDSSATNNLTWTSTGALNLTGPVTLSQTAGTTILNLGTYAATFTVGAGVNALNLNGGTLQGSGALTFNGGLLYTSGTNSHTGAWTQGTGTFSWPEGTTSRVKSYTVAAGATITATSTTCYTAKAVVPSTATINVGSRIFYAGRDPAGNDFLSLEGTWIGTGYVSIRTAAYTCSGPVKVGGLTISLDGITTLGGNVTCGALNLVSGAPTGTSSLIVGGVLSCPGLIQLGAAGTGAGLLTLGPSSTIGSVARTASANVGNTLTLGSSTVTLTGTLNGTGIAVSNTGATIHGGGTGQLSNVTCTGQTLDATDSVVDGGSNGNIVFVPAAGGAMRGNYIRTGTRRGGALRSA